LRHRQGVRHAASTGTETEVSFAAGENPVMPTKDVNWISFTPGEFWPQS
jgi:hypothetical protein